MSISRSDCSRGAEPSTTTSTKSEVASERVEQTRLADVRLTDDRDLKAFTDKTAARGIGQQQRCARNEPVERTLQIARLEKMIALVRKIDRRFKSSDQIEERVRDLRDDAGKRPVKLIERDSRLKRRHCIDQVSDSLGLHQIDSPVEKR